MGTIVDVSEVLLEMGLSASATEEERAIINLSIRRAEGVVTRYLGYDPLRLERTEFYPQRDVILQATAGVWVVEGTQAILRRAISVATDELQLIHLPIRAINTVHVDFDGRSGTTAGAFDPDTLKVIGSDFWPNFDRIDSDGASVGTDGILRNIGSWPTQPGTVKVVYTAGYEESEFRGTDTVLDASPIYDSVVQESVRRARRALALKKHAQIGHVAGILASERLGDYSYSLDTATAKSLFGGMSDLTAESMRQLESFVNWGVMV